MCNGNPGKEALLGNDSVVPALEAVVELGMTEEAKDLLTKIGFASTVAPDKATGPWEDPQRCTRKK